MVKKTGKNKVKLPVKKSLSITLIILAILEAVCIIVQAACLSKAIVSLFYGNYDILMDALLFFVGYIFRTIFLHLQQYFTEKEAVKLEKELRASLLESYVALGTDFLQKEGSGKSVTLAIEGIGQVKTFFELNVSKKMRSGIIPALVALYIFYTDKVSSIIIAGFSPVIVIFMILLGVTARDMADRQYKKYRMLSNNFIDTIRGIESLKFLGISKKYLPIMEKKNVEYRKSTMNTLRYAFLNSFALDILTTLAIAFLAVRLGILLLDGETYLLPSLTVLILAPEFFLPIKQAATDYHASLNGQVAYEEMLKIINKKPKYDEEYIEFEDIHSIELRNISLQKEENKILDNINLTINKEDKICVVGHSGSGKTSLISIMAAFTNQSSGQILINGKEVNLRNTNWLTKISYISQFPYIFPLSIKENILFYEEDNSISDEKLDDVCKLVGLYEFISNLEQGYDTLIGEGGVELSGGQAQRIAIARALISNREIIILDEPTSHLDIETEFEIKEKLLELFAGRIVIIATHRLHWLNNMDYVLHLEKGKLVDFKSLDLYRETESYVRLKKTLTGGESLEK